MLNWIGWLTQRIVLRGAKRMHKVKNQSLGYRAGWNQFSSLVPNNSLCDTFVAPDLSFTLRNFTQSLPYGWLWGWKASANVPGAPDFICLSVLCMQKVTPGKAIIWAHAVTQPVKAGLLLHLSTPTFGPVLAFSQKASGFQAGCQAWRMLQLAFRDSTLITLPPSSGRPVPCPALEDKVCGGPSLKDQHLL